MKNRFLLYAFIIILLIGIFFRFTNLGTKVYWGDETVTSLRISGYTLTELKQKASQGNKISVAELQKYQYPNADKNIVHTVMGLASEEPQHPPLYFVGAKFWVQLFGNSIGVTRGFSAIISLLALPCIYWLSQELFDFPLASWIAVALISISPFHVLYAQEARSYSLWTVTILLASASFLRAIRTGTNLSWIIYTLTLLASFYTFFLSGLIVIGHGIYLCLIEGFKITKTIKSYITALLASLLFFSPWIFIIFKNYSQANSTTDWTQKKTSLLPLVKVWLLNISRLYFDFNYNFINQNYFIYAIIGLWAILTGYSIYFLYLSTPLRVWSFIAILMGVTASILIIPDLFLGGIRSSVARYVIPCYLGIHLAVAYLLASKLSSNKLSQFHKILWKVLTITIISSGIISCANSAQASVWWNKYNAAFLPPTAQIINQSLSPSPIVVTSWQWLMAFSHILNPRVILLPIERKPIVIDNHDNSDIFVYNSSSALKALMETEELNIDHVYKWKTYIEPVYPVNITLWKLTKS